MNQSNRAILFLTLLLCIILYGAMVVVQVMQRNQSAEILVSPGYSGFTPYSNNESLLSVQFVSSARRNHRYSPVFAATPMPQALMGSTSSVGNGGIYLTSSVKPTAYCGGNCSGGVVSVGSSSTVSVSSTPSSLPNLMVAMVAPVGSGRFTTSASELEGDEAEDGRERMLIGPHRASDPGDVLEEEELPIGDMVYPLLLMLLAYCGHVKVQLEKNLMFIKKNK